MTHFCQPQVHWDLWHLRCFHFIEVWFLKTLLACKCPSWCASHLPNCTCSRDCAAARLQLRAPTRVPACRPADTPSPLVPRGGRNREGKKKRKKSRPRIFTSTCGWETLTKTSDTPKLPTTTTELQRVWKIGTKPPLLTERKTPPAAR